MLSLSRTEIEQLIDLPLAAQAIEEAYRAASRGDVNLPPVGHITFPGDADCHIKYGHIKGDEVFVIKVATGFPGNSAVGRPTGNGLVLVLSAETGAVLATLYDEMMLTDLRTGLGGAIASRTLARANSRKALIVGTGPQARQQIEAHAALMPKLEFTVWGRDPQKAAALAGDMETDVRVRHVTDLATAALNADIIVTATGATQPFLRSDWVGPGTHITAVGADAPGKQELDVALVARADVIAVDLASQCVDHGEVCHAVKAGLVQPDALIEIGALLEDAKLGRRNDEQITMADLTGISAQDIAIAKAVLQTWDAENR